MRNWRGTGRGTVGKTAVVAAKDRRTKKVVARVIDNADKPTLQGFVDDHASADAKLYTDYATAYKGTDRDHETVNHTTLARRSSEWESMNASNPTSGFTEFGRPSDGKSVKRKSRGTYGAAWWLPLARVSLPERRVAYQTGSV